MNYDINHQLMNSVHPGRDPYASLPTMDDLNNMPGLTPPGFIDNSVYMQQYQDQNVNYGIPSQMYQPMGYQYNYINVAPTQPLVYAPPEAYKGEFANYITSPESLNIQNPGLDSISYLFGDDFTYAISSIPRSPLTQAEIAQNQLWNPALAQAQWQAKYLQGMPVREITNFNKDKWTKEFSNQLLENDSFWFDILSKSTALTSSLNRVLNTLWDNNVKIQMTKTLDNVQTYWVYNELANHLGLDADKLIAKLMPSPQQGNNLMRDLKFLANFNQPQQQMRHQQNPYSGGQVGPPKGK